MSRRHASLLLLLLGAGAAATVAGASEGWSHALPTFLIFCAAGAPVVGLAHLVAGQRGRLGSLSRQFAAGVVLSVSLVLGVSARPAC